MDIDNVNFEFKNKLDDEINKLIINNWNFLNEPWPEIRNRFNHRTKIKDIKNNDIMKEIKQELLEKLGYIPVYYFLTKLYTNREYPGPYREIEKGLILLYHIVSGRSGPEMANIIPYTSFYDLYKDFWINNYNNINKQVKFDLENLFSNIKIRVLAANAYNPTGFENVTLYIDGHDSKVKYYNPNESTSGLYSYKLKGPGLRTQIVVDINKSILFVSNSEKCAKGSDGTMFLNMKLYKNIHKLDCIGMDGGYNLFVEKFIENANEFGYDFNHNNFVYPIRKEVNKKLNVNELSYNDKFGSFRSEIENHFSLLASKFNRFNNNKEALQMTDKRYYNIQFRVACLLKNIHNFVDNYNIEIKPHHMLWYSDRFEFPTKINKINLVFSNEQKVNKKYNEMRELQSKILSLSIEDIEKYNENNDTYNKVEIDDIPKKRKRNQQNKNSNENVYQVEKILDHMVDDNNNFIFYVKWYGYNESENSWVKQNDFNTKDIINQYLKDRNIQ